MKNEEIHGAKPLTVREQEILEEIYGYIERLEKFNGMTIKEYETMNRDYKSNLRFYCTDLDSSILKAYRANLHNHPMIPRKIKDVIIDWVKLCRDLGQVDRLQEARTSSQRSKLTQGIKRPLTRSEVILIGRVIELRDGGNSWETICNILIDEGIIEQMSRQGLQKKVKTLFPYI